MTMIFVWAAVFALMLILELATAGLATIWFCAGSLVALVLAIFKVEIIWQVVAFVVVSVLLLIFTRPIIRKLRRGKGYSPTNSDRAVGRRTVVAEDIDALAGTGSVKIDGVVWSARSSDGHVIRAGTDVVITGIEGVKAVVDEAGEPAAEESAAAAEDAGAKAREAGARL